MIPRQRTLIVIAETSTDLVATEDGITARALTYIRQLACQGIWVANVARHVGVSRSTLDNRFRQLAGRTAHSEIRRAQLSSARQLLVTTDLSLDEIAHRAGFGTAQYMNAVFRRVLKRTPGQYRRVAR